MFDKDRHDNRQGYRDGKLGMLLKTDMTKSYIKGWIKGFKKFVLANPKTFFNKDKSVIEATLKIELCGVPEGTASLLAMEAHSNAITV